MLRKCGGCKLAYWCSVQCQTSDWPKHKAECKVSKMRDTIYIDRAEAADKVRKAAAIEKQEADIAGNGA